MGYSITYTKQAIKDEKLLKQHPSLYKKAFSFIQIIEVNPFQMPPDYEKLKGDLDGSYSRRLNKKHRMVYQVYEEQKVIKITSLWSHYENV